MDNFWTLYLISQLDNIRLIFGTISFCSLLVGCLFAFFTSAFYNVDLSNREVGTFLKKQGVDLPQTDGKPYRTMIENGRVQYKQFIEKEYKKFRRATITLFLISMSFFIVKCLLPTTKQSIFIMSGVVVTELSNDPDVKRITKKTLHTFEKFIDDATEKESTQEKK